MKKILFALSAFFLLVISTQTSCYYDNEVEQYGVTVCDTTAISYSADIKPIIDRNCISCHTPGGQQSTSPLNTHAQLNAFSANSELMNRIRGIGVSLMPPTAPLTNCDQQKIEAWVRAGSPNN